MDNRISHSTLPVGNEGGIAFFGSDNPGVPAVEAGTRLQQARGVNLPNFDFFNYAGITRPVRLCATPMACIRDVTLVPSTDGVVRYRVETVGTGDICIAILDAQGQTVAAAQGAEGTLRVENPRLWQPRPGTPTLYTAHITFGEDICDQPFGFRSVEVRGHQLLINGAPIHLHGPCKHEDTPFHGRGLDLCADVLDLLLYGWLNANVLRMSHYPYAEEVYALCDREGILVIDETPAVGIGAGDRVDPYKAFPLFDYHAQVLAGMIARDKNHPCVILWSLGNEPDTEHFSQSACDYWRPLYELAHRLDPQNRPVTLVCCQNDYTRDLITRTMDVVCVNRYYGWYNLSGDLETAKYALNLELDFWETIDKAAHPLGIRRGHNQRPARRLAGDVQRGVPGGILRGHRRMPGRARLRRRRAAVDVCGFQHAAGPHARRRQSQGPLYPGQTAQARRACTAPALGEEIAVCTAENA